MMERIGSKEVASTMSSSLLALQWDPSEYVPAMRISPKGPVIAADTPCIHRKRNTELFLFMSTNIAESLRQSMQALVSNRAQVDAKLAISETTLIRNGAFCGRRFSCAGFSLVWFQEEGQVKLYNPDGALEQSCSVSQFCLCNMQSNAMNIRRAA